MINGTKTDSIAALTAFLSDRIADTEAAAADVADLASVPEVIDSPRLLAECEAKRRILAIYRGSLNAEAMARTAADANPTSDELITMLAMTGSVRATAEGVCLLLAAVYADHPDYQETWRP